MKFKQELGQYYTKNANYIVGDLLNIFPNDCTIIDMFAGEFDLLNLVNHKIEAYDIDPKNNSTQQRDTLIDPPSYDDKWILTNPPFLARNKCKNKYLYEKYQTDDLYKASLISILGCKGGVIILPLNFFSSEDEKIRRKFLSNYKIIKLKIFEETVFADTTYTVCAFCFIKEQNNHQNINAIFYPNLDELSIDINKDEGYRIGYEIFNLPQSNIEISRLLIGETPNSNIFLHAIDTGSVNGLIKLSIDDYYYGKLTDRAFATIKLSKNFSLDQQEQIVYCFNNKLNFYRKKYKSLFLTNFRNSTNYMARKRISFSLAYQLISNVIKELDYD